MKRILGITNNIAGPHQHASVFEIGEQTDRALILIHGRGGSAEDVASLREAVGATVYTVLPEAAWGSWYPNRFLVPQADNQPALDSALAVVDVLVSYLEGRGITKNKIVLAGFSQGACLAAEYVARHPALYGAVVLMSGGLIGEDIEVVLENYHGSLQGTPVYIGCDSADDHIPLARVEETNRVFVSLGAQTTLEIFSGYGHRPHPSALHFLQSHLEE